jgi:hypothetical protein
LTSSSSSFPNQKFATFQPSVSVQAQPNLLELFQDFQEQNVLEKGGQKIMVFWYL